MNSFPNSARLLKDGIVPLDTVMGAVQMIVVLQYNPDTLTRNLQVQTFSSGDTNDRSEALRFKKPPLEAIEVESDVMRGSKL